MGNPIDDYIAAQPAEVQPILKKTREALAQALPDCAEKISYGMPTYWRKHNIIHFAAQKHHLGIYPGPEAIIEFTDRLSDYKTSKGAIQFPYDKPIPYDLISEIAAWANDRNGSE